MLRLAADEDFDGDIVRGLRRRLPDLDLVRVRAGLPMPGVVAVPQSMATGHAIDELELFAAASEEGEWEGQVLFVSGAP